MSSNPSLDSEWAEGKRRQSKKSITEWDRLMALRFGWTEAEIEARKQKASAFLRDLDARVRTTLRGSR